MKTYAAHGVRDFVICLGYMGYKIKEYFANYYLHSADVTFEPGGSVTYHRVTAEPWRVTLIDTGEDTMTGGRVRRISSYLPKDRPFFLTYGDGVSDVDITELLAFHQSHGRMATVTAVRPLARFGALDLEGSAVRAFKEKPVEEGGFINGGFMVLQPEAANYPADDTTVWEQGPMERLAEEGNLQAFFHEGFWQPMDALRDKSHLVDLWERGQAPWKIW
jgi:glucose-1-phosphate cytidylyltransferase